MSEMFGQNRTVRLHSSTRTYILLHTSYVQRYGTQSMPLGHLPTGSALETDSKKKR